LVTESATPLLITWSATDALELTVVGHQWWWEIRYPKLGIATANEIHIPVSEAAKPAPTFITLESVDVVHSFWVPQLAGKMDLTLLLTILRLVVELSSSRVAMAGDHA
jgi:heme/copper-type cytochrome/quinol oxidase subunit 2